MFLFDPVCERLQRNLIVEDMVSVLGLCKEAWTTLKSLHAPIAFALTRTRLCPNTDLSCVMWSEVWQRCANAVSAEGWSPAVFANSLEFRRERWGVAGLLPEERNFEVVPPHTVQPLLTAAWHAAVECDEAQGCEQARFIWTDDECEAKASPDDVAFAIAVQGYCYCACDLTCDHGFVVAGLFLLNDGRFALVHTRCREAAHRAAIWLGTDLPFLIASAKQAFMSSIWELSPDGRLTWVEARPERCLGWVPGVAEDMDEDDFPLPGWQDMSENACVHACRMGYGRLHRKLAEGFSCTFQELQDQCPSRADAMARWAQAEPVALQELTPDKEALLVRLLGG